MRNTADAESEIKAALASLVAAIKPWMMEGAPGRYAGKKVGFFAEDGSDRQWVQRGQSPLNPYGKAPARLMPWPARARNEGSPAAASTPSTGMTGGHGAHAAPAVGKGG